MTRPRLVARQVSIAEEQEEFKPVTAALVTNTQYRVREGSHRTSCQRFQSCEQGYELWREVACTCNSKEREYNTVVVAFEPTEYERAQIARGERVYVSLLTYGDPMQGIIMSVGDKETAGIYRVEVET